MSAEKTEKPQDTQKTQEDSPPKKEAVDRQKAADERGSWNENPEKDGYRISPDRKTIEMFYNWDLDDAEHHDWIRTARKRASKDVNEDKDRQK